MSLSSQSRGVAAPSAAPFRHHVEYLAIDVLRLDGRNPRIHSPRQIKQIARSIKTFGFTVPVLVDAHLRLIAGHGRCLAAASLGWTEVPTLCLSHLTQAQASAYRIADNRLTEIATWDEQLLGAEFERLAALDLDFNLDVTGFDPPQIDILIEDVGGKAQAAADAAERLPEPIAGPPVTQPGDLWQLGRHRVVCGSALVERSYRQVMGRSRAAIVFTDPPYNVPIAGHASGLGQVKHADFAMAVGEMSVEDFTDFLAQTCRLLSAYSRAGSLHYLCMDWRHIQQLLAAGEGVYTDLMNLCVWAKDNAGMGSLYRSQHELIAVFKRGRARHRNNIELGRHGRYRSNVWRYPGANSFAGRKSDEGNLLALHPTVKPVAMVADALLDASVRDDTVLDAFLGSGTTLMAAERTGRVCHGIELEPRYVDAAIRRWQTYTGEAATLTESGHPFAGVAAQRGAAHG